jgi:hypothetical protein
MLNVKELIERLPGSWSELTFAKYKTLLDLTIEEQDDFGGLFVGADNTIKILSRLTGASVEELEQLPLASIQQLSSRLSWMGEVPEAQKTSTIKWKELDKVTYNDYITYLQLSGEPLKHMTTIIKAFSTTELTEQEIDELSVQVVITGFQLLHQHVMKSMRRTAMSLLMKLPKQMVKGWVNKLQQLFKKKTTR